MPHCEKGKHEVRMVSEVRFPDGHEEHWCCDCWNADVRERQAKRKAELASAPRCEVLGCKARGTTQVAHCILMCGRHFHKAQNSYERQAAQAGVFSLCLPCNYSREELLRAAV